MSRVLEETQAQRQKVYDKIINLLVSAGYFRARIPALSPFDKVVGGMAWCLTASSVDVDFDVTFKENPNIREKIKISENILQAMKASGCKLSCQPVHIQGLDYERLYPIIQWLVGKTFEFRASTERSFRRSAEFTYRKEALIPSDEDRKYDPLADSLPLSAIQKEIPPVQRLYRQKRRLREIDEEARIQRILLEYGKTSGVGLALSKLGKKKRKGKGEEEDEEEDDEEKAREKERVAELMQGMEGAAAHGQHDGVKADTVGKLLGLNSDEMNKAIKLYDEQKKQIDLSSTKQHVEALKQKLDNLEKLIQGKKSHLQEQVAKLKAMKEQNDEEEAEVEKIEEELNENRERMAELKAEEDKQDPGVVQNLRRLVELNETLKEQEKMFKVNCKKQFEYWQKLVLDVRMMNDPRKDERTIALKTALSEESAKLQRMRTLLAQKNREIASQQRLIDEIPTRPELFQYQTRFIELFGLMGIYLDETRKHINTFNTLVDRKTCLDRETTTIQSIIETFPRSMKQRPTQIKLIEDINNICEQTGKSLKKQEGILENQRVQHMMLTQKYNKLVEEKKQYLALTKRLQDEMETNARLQQRVEEMEERERQQEDEDDEDEDDEDDEGDDEDEEESQTRSQSQSQSQSQTRSQQREEEEDEDDEDNEDDDEDDDEEDEGYSKTASKSASASGSRRQRDESDEDDDEDDDSEENTQQKRKARKEDFDEEDNE
ncbi:putative Coiled-coil domain containing 93 [Monocercomonoides exilis]|uniref:putative Coiled-coil domain containing 93 n=1 Tax=Monocercomonoides exilis TaxID=2049356 RepID=UPI00355A36ED|nr:putative Coiled-coil domain containing 93 [Monocercomonoides exilis]|eukprot:MONOS_8392.1-p1 / transcript=MONOS_8392.1 / gene=MONOS_8392 / organism=Monocercomonoides_exilis_PA203 / gene_product=Coiled-coil domain containing 93 / transcript_product=Coiled-coil domain containing 93 / location=Mono_scaffold00315:27395-30791(+) / protein_length=718 / sequence_SO=supercontig / SO=protein_coding / is_pseudo=false